MSSNEDATIGVKRSSDVIENEEHEDTIPKKVATLVSAAAPNVTADADTATYMIKVLCPEPAIGVVIGKKGAALQEMIAATNAEIKISQNSQLFPGTTDRTISVRGSTEVLAVALDRLFNKIIEGSKKLTQHALPNPSSSQSIRLCIPAMCAGALIGTGGSTIRRLIESTNCHLKMAESNDDSHAAKERLLTISAPLVEKIVFGAVAVLATLVQECKTNFTYVNSDVGYGPPKPSPTPGFAPHMYAPQMMLAPPYQSMPQGQYQPAPQYLQKPPGAAVPSATLVPPPMPPTSSVQQPYPQQAPQYMPMQHLPAGYPQQYQQQQQYYAFDPNTLAPYPLSTDIADMPPPSYAVDAAGNVTGTFLVPERYMGGVLGKGGSIVKNIMQVSGALTKAGQKGDVIDGFPDFRMIRITGANAQVQQASLMLTNRLVELVHNPRLGK